jgi:heme exporter protein C
MKPQPLVLKILNIVSAILLAGAFAMAMWYAPVEKVMGAVQKVFYFHVAVAWVGMLGFLAAAVAGIVYLRTRDLKWDIVEVAAVEISLVFFLIAILLGSIWARPAWGTYWTWEPRLTTAAILEMIYIALLLLRQSLEEPEKRARFSAVYTLVGSISIPITFLSIRFSRTIHPVVIGAGEGAQMNMTPEMLATMFVSIAVFSVIFVTLFWHRIRLGRLAAQVEQVRLKAMQ